MRDLPALFPPRPPKPALVDPRETTLDALDRLPPPMHCDGLYAMGEGIPFLYDGRRWHALPFSPTQHLGVFGTTQLGKSSLMELIALLALDLGPDTAHVWMLDPKSGLNYQDIAMPLAHARLYADVIDEQTGANRYDGSLQDGYLAARKEMHRRNGLMAQINAKDIFQYNRRAEMPIPFLLILADEVFMISPAQRTILGELAGMGAGAGIIVVVATHHPTADVLPNQVQANLTNRVVMGLANERLIAVAMGSQRGRPTYDPSVIDEPGVAVLRRPGSEVLGRIPYVTNALRTVAIADLAARYPRHPEPAEPPPEISPVSTVPVANGGFADQWRELLDELLLQQSAEKQPEKLPEISGKVSARFDRFFRVKICF